MLVSFNPSISNNRYKSNNGLKSKNVSKLNSSTSFKAKPPYILANGFDLTNICTEALAAKFRATCTNVCAHRAAPRTPETIAAVDVSIEKAKAKGNMILAQILEDAKLDWKYTCPMPGEILL